MKSKKETYKQHSVECIPPPRITSKYQISSGSSRSGSTQKVNHLVLGSYRSCTPNFIQIRSQHFELIWIQDLDPDPGSGSRSGSTQKLITWSLSHTEATHQISSKSVNNFLSYFVYRQTDRQTHKHGQKHTSFRLRRRMNKTQYVLTRERRAAS